MQRYLCDQIPSTQLKEIRSCRWWCQEKQHVEVLLYAQRLKGVDSFEFRSKKRLVE